MHAAPGGEPASPGPAVTLSHIALAVAAGLVAVLDAEPRPLVTLVVALFAALVAAEHRRAGSPGSQGPVAPWRWAAEAILCAGLLVGADRSDLAVVAVLAMLPAAGSMTRPTGPPALGAVVVAAIGLAAVVDVARGAPPDPGVLGAELVLVLISAGWGAVLAREGARRRRRLARVAEARADVLADGIALARADRAAALEEVESAVAPGLVALDGLLARDPPQLVAARRATLGLAGRLRAVVAELHPAARRSRRPAERVRAGLERTGTSAEVQGDLAGCDPALVELLLVLLRPLGGLGPESEARAELAPRADRGLVVALELEGPGAREAGEAVAGRVALLGGCGRASSAAGGVTALRVELPPLDTEAGAPLTRPVGIDAHRLRTSLVVSRAAFVAVVVGYGALTGALGDLGAASVAVAGAAWTACTAWLARADRLPRAQLDGRLALVDVALLGGAVAVTGGTGSPLPYALATLPAIYAWTFPTRAARRLVAALALAVALGWAGATAAGDAVDGGRAGAVAVVLGLGAVIAVGAARTRAELAASELELARRRAASVVDGAEVADRERRRLAFALHDGPLQTLLSLRQDLEEALLEPERRDAVAWRRTVARARTELAAADGDPAAGPGGARAQLARLLVTAAARGGLATELRLGPDAEPAQAGPLVAIAAELLANVVRHAEAGHVALALRAVGDDVELEVADDGRGLPAGRVAAAPAAGHVGLASCAERARCAGGVLHVGAAPGGGALVRVRVPRARLASGGAQRAAAHTA